MAISPRLAKRILEERAKSKFSVDSLYDPLFPQQKAFADDPAKLKVLYCTRRSAKSYTAGLYLVQQALLNPGCNLLFIGLTRQSSKGIIWKDILKTLNTKNRLGIRFNGSDLTATFPNGSVIRVTGVDADADEMKKLLGLKYRLVCIDEGSMFTIDVRELVYGILKPAMVDPNAGGERGTIAMFGTSSNFTRGLFYDITTGKEAGWKVHTWTAHDNPYVAKQWAEELEDIRINRPLYMETPQFRQWYLNEWVVDENKLVYRFNESRNLYKDMPNLPNGGWTYLLGVDTGWEDDNAFVLCGFHENDKRLYVIKTFNKAKMTFDQVVLKIQEFMADKDYPIAKVIIDGANKQGVESMRSRSQIPFVYADKTGKVDHIEMLNGDLVQGKVLIQESNKELVNELMSLVWKTKGDVIVLPKKEHPALPNHLCDAFLYSWRHAYHYHSEPAVPVLVVGSKEWYQKTTTDMWDKEREAFDKEINSGWPEDWNGWGKD